MAADGLIDEIYRAMRRIEEINYQPRKIRCGSGFFWRLRQAAPKPIYDPFPNVITPFGYDVVVDRWLPDDVWRLTDLDDTLLYDCREGKLCDH